MIAWIRRQFTSASTSPVVPVSELVVTRRAGWYSVAALDPDGVEDLGIFPDAGRAWAAIDGLDAPGLGLGRAGERGGMLDRVSADETSSAMSRATAVRPMS